MIFKIEGDSLCFWCGYIPQVLIPDLQVSWYVVFLFMLPGLCLCLPILWQCFLLLLSFMATVFIIGCPIKRGRVKKLKRENICIRHRLSCYLVLICNCRIVNIPTGYMDPLFYQQYIISVSAGGGVQHDPLEKLLTTSYRNARHLLS